MQSKIRTLIKMNWLNKEELIKLIDRGKINYNKIKNDSIVIIQNPDEIYDINFFIPVRERMDFAEPMYKSFLRASEKSNLRITYTVIEHNDIPLHSNFCKKNKINYIWLPCNQGDLFNKCLCYNMGVFFSNKSKYYLFHDIDCLIQSDFFLKLTENIKNKECRAIQCFTKRRVLYINREFTPNLVSGKFNVDDLNIKMTEVDYPRMNGQIMLGAPGGSILVERDLFFEVGGYDSELFLANSPEDAFFWTKIDTVNKMHTSDNPDIEIYHMYHDPTWSRNPLIREMEVINKSFDILSSEDKKEVIKHKSELINEFK